MHRIRCPYCENVWVRFETSCSSKRREAVSWLAWLQTVLSSATQRARGSMDGWHITPTPKTVPWWMAPIMAMTFLFVTHSFSLIPFIDFLLSFLSLSPTHFKRSCVFSCFSLALRLYFSLLVFPSLPFSFSQWTFTKTVKFEFLTMWFLHLSFSDSSDLVSNKPRHN